MPEQGPCPRLRTVPVGLQASYFCLLILNFHFALGQMRPPHLENLTLKIISVALGPPSRALPILLVNSFPGGGIGVEVWVLCFASDHSARGYLPSHEVLHLLDLFLGADPTGHSHGNRD